MRVLSGAHDGYASLPRTRVMRFDRSGLPSSPFDSTDDVTGFGGRAPSGIGFITDAAGTGIHQRSRSSSESRSETNATFVPSGETRGYVSLSFVSVNAIGDCHASEPITCSVR